MKIDPIHQFNIEPLFTIGHIGKQAIVFTNSSLYMFVAVALTAVLMLGRRTAAGPRPLPVDRRNLLRIRRQHDPLQRRRGRHEVLPADLLAVHVHLRLEPRRHHPLHVHGFEPHHRHRRAGASGVRHRADLRPLQERPEILQDFRAVRRSDLHPAAGDVHRNPVVLPASRSRTPCVCSPTCWPAISR